MTTPVDAMSAPSELHMYDGTPPRKQQRRAGFSCFGGEKNVKAQQAAMSIKEHSLEGNMHQGKHGTCVFHALARVINDMMIFKYNIGMDMDFIIHMLESSSVDPRSPVYKTQIEGCSIPAAVAAINDGIHENFFCMMMGRKRVCKFRNKENGDRYCISLKAKKVNFKELNAILGVQSGYCCAVVIIRQERQRGGEKVDHTYHGVAAFARMQDGRLKVKNSWGSFEPTLDVTRENYEEGYIVFPKLERLKTLSGVTRKDIPPSEDFHEFKNAYKNIMNSREKKAVGQECSLESSLDEDSQSSQSLFRQQIRKNRRREKEPEVDDDAAQYTREMMKSLADCPLMVATDPGELRVEDKKDLLSKFAEFLNSDNMEEQYVTNLYFRHFLLKMLTDEAELNDRLQVKEAAAAGAQSSKDSSSKAVPIVDRSTVKNEKHVNPFMQRQHPMIRQASRTPVMRPGARMAAAPHMNMVVGGRRATQSSGHSCQLEEYEQIEETLDSLLESIEEERRDWGCSSDEEQDDKLAYDRA